jgi:hypothetical protein
MLQPKKVAKIEVQIEVQIFDQMSDFTKKMQKIDDCVEINILSQ